MKKNLKKIIRIIIKFFVIFLGKINTGRFFLEELNRSILSYKKVIVYKDLKLKFYAPNRLSYYRIETFSTKEPETLNWIEKFEKKLLFGMLVLILGFIVAMLQKVENVRYMLLNHPFLILNG